MSPLQTSPADRALLIRLYKEKLQIMSDIPSASDFTIELYIRAFPNMPSELTTSRTKKLDSWFKDLSFFLKLKDGTQVFSKDQFFAWLNVRPRFCDTFKKYLGPIEEEIAWAAMDEKLEKL